MELTKEQAIDKSIELWEFLAKTGDGKGNWSRWGEFKLMGSNFCFLCEYDVNLGSLEVTNDGCPHCPYFQKFGSCENGVYAGWQDAVTRINRKKYAKLFLEQLKELKRN